MTAWLALILSTCLVLLRAWEFWKDRFHINVRAMQTSNYELGNTVWIRNLSGKPVIVEYWEVFWRSGRWPRRKEGLIDSPGEFAKDIQIAPRASHSLTFSGPDYVDWSVHAARGRTVLIGLHIAGRKGQVLRKLTGKSHASGGHNRASVCNHREDC